MEKEEQVKKVDEWQEEKWNKAESGLVASGESGKWKWMNSKWKNGISKKVDG